MKYYAEINTKNVVKRVLVFAPNDSLEWVSSTFGGTWVEAWDDGGQRKNYPGPGYKYDKTRDAFVPPQPFSSWVLDEETCQWQPPTPYPEDGSVYLWSEEETDWVEVIEE
jgi:hypothetical protein